MTSDLRSSFFSLSLPVVLSVLLSFIISSFSATAQAAHQGDIYFDIGAGSGTTGKDSVSYSEIDFGINYFLYNHLDWRNALFARFPTTGSTGYGLDTSGRFIGRVDLFNSLGITGYAGPGFRFQTKDLSAPLLEAGVIFHFPALSAGLGYKSILNSWVQTNAPNDNQLLLILGVGGL